MENKRPLSITLICAFQVLSIGLFTFILLIPQKLGFIWNLWINAFGITNEALSLKIILPGKWYLIFSFLLSVLIIRGLWKMRRWAFIVYLISAIYGLVSITIGAFYGKPIISFSLAWSIILLIVLLLNFKQSTRKHAKKSEIEKY